MIKHHRSADDRILLKLTNTLKANTCHTQSQHKIPPFPVSYITQLGCRPVQTCKYYCLTHLWHSGMWPVMVWREQSEWCLHLLILRFIFFFFSLSHTCPCSEQRKILSRPVELSLSVWQHFAVIVQLCRGSKLVIFLFCVLLFRGRWFWLKPWIIYREIH